MKVGREQERTPALFTQCRGSNPGPFTWQGVRTTCLAIQADIFASLLAFSSVYPVSQPPPSGGAGWWGLPPGWGPTKTLGLCLSCLSV